MSDESENYITPIFPAEDEEEEEEVLNNQEGGAPSVEPKAFLNKYGSKLLSMFQNGYSTTFSKVLPPIDSILKFKEDGKVIEMKSIADMQANKVDKAFLNFPNLVLYQFLQKIALYQSVGGSKKPDYDLNKHIALIEISVRLYVLSYFLATKNDTVALKDQFTDMSKKYFDNKEVSTYHSYFEDLKTVLPKLQSGLFNNPTDGGENTDLEIVSNVLTHYGVVYFKLGNTYTKLEKKEILATENLYFYNTMSEMLDDLIAKVPEPPAPAAPAAPAPAAPAPAAEAINAGLPAAVNAGLPAAVNAGLPAAANAGLPAAVNAGLPAAVNAGLPAAVNAGLPAAANAGLPAAEGQAVVGANAGLPAAVPANAAAVEAGNLRGGSRKNRRSHRRNTSRKNRED